MDVATEVHIQFQWLNILAVGLCTASPVRIYDNYLCAVGKHYWSRLGWFGGRHRQWEYTGKRENIIHRVLWSSFLAYIECTQTLI